MTDDEKRATADAVVGPRPENRGIAMRCADECEVYRRTGDRRAAIYAYCAGNKWLLENARAVGNLPRGW